MDNKFESMLEANKITHEALEHCKNIIMDSESITKKEVETLAGFFLTRYDVKSAFQNVNGFPGIMCISVNDEVIHGLPNEDRIVKGDIVSLDFGIRYNGYCSDAAITFLNDSKILNPISKKRKLVRATKEALDKSIKSLEKAFPNCKISDITKAIEPYGEEYGIVLNYGGHGIGKNLHDPSIFIPNELSAIRQNKELKIGDYFTIEPMFTLGSGETYIGEDGFTIKTKDGSLSAHFEYSITITKEGIVILK